MPHPFADVSLGAFDGNAARSMFDTRPDAGALIQPLDEMAAKRAAKKGAKKAPTRKKPGGGLTDMGALRRVDPEGWAAKVREAMEAAEGRVPKAAEALGVSSRTLFLWLDDDLLKDIDRAPMGQPRKNAE